MSAIVFLGSLSACGSPSKDPAVELASVMGDAQRHSAKLGYALAVSNQRLADFYLHEIEEILEILEGVPEHDGLPIAEPSQIILGPEVETMKRLLDDGDLAGATTHYPFLINACNRCHAATEHEFLVITPASGPSPYNQDFAADPREVLR